MKRAIAIAIALVAIGCRGIIGIDDLTLVDGGSDGSADAGSDAHASDAAPDAPPPCGNTTTRQACVMCCFQNGTPQELGAFGMLVDQNDSCVCSACSAGGAPCPTSMKVCGGSATAAMTMCPGCAAGQIIDPHCPSLANACNADTQCKQLASCLASCKQL